jgi:serine/threonine protein kinase
VALNPGTRLGPYEVVGPLGAGGMGEVYRARDTRLGREVAVKVLPEHLSANPEVRARFEREAKTISGFNHPHICTLFDVGQEGDTHFLVMELVEGRSLADRLDRGPLPTTEVLQIGGQIADALDRAHRVGVIHRDLKPANVMLAKSGAKLMDFGLARPTLPESEDIAQSISPTMSRPLTAEGTIVGTFQYMAPEQLEGKESDARSDLWALGCVLYEMATGKRAFEGPSQASLIGQIMKGEPAPMHVLQPITPPALERLVDACLRKDPADRIQSAHDVKLQLTWIAEGGSQAGVPAPVAARRRGRERLAWALVGLLAASLVGGVGWWALHRPEPPQTVRLRLQLPEDNWLPTDPGLYSLSPDGSQIAISSFDDRNISRIWLRRLDSVEATALPGTEGAQFSFWSPDGRYLCFATVDRLKKLDLRGGAPEVLCDLEHYGRGGSWGRDGTILIASEPEGPLYRLPAGGGELQQVTELDSLESAHRFPHFLPDGRHYIFAVLPGLGGEYEIYVGDLESGQRERLLTADGVPKYVEPGYLLYSRNDRVVAQRFDAERRKLLGEPITLPDEPSGTAWTGYGRISASRRGIFLYVQERAVDTELQRVDLSGRLLGPQAAPEGRYVEMDISKDGNQAALVKEISSSENELWILNLKTGTGTRLTSDRGRVSSPVLSPDGSRVVYSSNRSGAWEMYVQDTAGTSEERLIPTAPSNFKFAWDWTPDGNLILYSQLTRETQWDLWAVDPDGATPPQAYLQTPVVENHPKFSPDGRWVVYTSFETGRPEIVVRSYPQPGPSHRVSRDGGRFPIWRQDGKVIYFRNQSSELMEASVTTQGGTFSSQAPRRLSSDLSDEAIEWLPSPDGTFVLQAVPVGGGSADQPVNVVLNWEKGLAEE